jgi:DNA replication licensing factor MCM4
MVSIKGFVVRVSNPIPEMKRGYFKCSLCDHVVLADVENGMLTEPEICTREECQQGTMQLVHGNCSFYNKQIIRLQETPGLLEQVAYLLFMSYRLCSGWTNASHRNFAGI